jgi:hypothetical protein
MYKPIFRSLKTLGYFWKKINHEIKNNNNTNRENLLKPPYPLNQPKIAQNKYVS